MTGTEYKNFNDIELNPEQKEAVFHPGGPLIVYAGAGTGKTRVITCRIAHLILEKNISPTRILAITFTNKAAFEMKRRVIEMVSCRRSDENGFGGDVKFGFPLWISTFHSFCARILKIDSESFGVAKDFAIYDEDDQKRILKEVLKEVGFGNNDKVYRPGNIAEKINRLKDSLIDAETYALSVGGSTNADERILADIYLRYNKKLQLHNALDFGDLILKVVERFKQDRTLLEKYQKKFDHILVDEYQDTNIAQYHLVKYLSALPPKNLCVVGDDDQSIYSWRGADRRNIINFQVDYPGAKIVKLERNYRSTPQILRAGVGVISNNIERYPKTLRPTLSDGDEISWQEFSSDVEEAQAVVFNIKKLVEDENIPPSKIAILYRMNSQSRVLEDAFISAGIPYRLVGSVRFYERQEVKNIIAYLRVVRNPSDEISLKRIINVPARGVGDATIEKLSTLAYANKKTIFDVIADENLLAYSNIGAKTSNRLLSLAEKIKKWRLYAAPSGDGQKMPLSELARLVAEESGYMDELRQENTPESLSRLENIKELINAIAEYEEISANPSLSDWLNEFALMGESDKSEGSSDGVILTTIHLAKGLEFDVVFIVGMEESIFPLASSWHNPQDMEEERRLCYVAITRAKKKLFMSSARFKMIYGKTSYLMPSRFVKEAMSSVFEKHSSDEISRSVGVSEDKKASVEAAMVNDIYGWREGQRVRHKLFGTGVVASVSTVDENTEDVKLVVRFDNGHTRKFYAKYAGFEIL